MKHFKFEERGKRRIHKKPSRTEVVACKPWLDAELACIRPDLIVCPGSTAARAVPGRQHQLLKERGRFFEYAQARSVMATVHPSAILRSPGTEQRRHDYEAFVQDLRQVSQKLSEYDGIDK